MTWDRIETMGHSIDLEEGVKASIADPFWMLGRQWQVGEFRGDNASQPVSVSVTAEIVPMGSFRPGDHGTPVSLTPKPGMPPLPPLETLAEAAVPEPNGYTGVSVAARMGQDLAHRLQAAGLGDVAEIFRAHFGFGTLNAGLAGTGQARAALRLLSKRGIDARRLLPDPNVALNNVLARLAQGLRDRVDELMKDWRAAHTQALTPSWDGSQFEHRFSLAALSGDGEVVLKADGHRGGHLDWYQFDISNETHALTENHPDHQKEYTRHAFPTPVRYAGMPAARWWELEDHTVHMGDVQSGPGDFARLMVAEFATSYSDDWFMVPLRVPRGSIARITEISVHDNFESQAHKIAHISQADSAPVGEESSPPARAFRLFEMTGDPGPALGLAPWLFVPATLASSMEGATLERVELARDEGANLAWAIERVVEGPLGRAFDRGREWFASDAGQPLVPPPATSGVYADQSWSYHLHSDAPPPWWIPFLPEQIEGRPDVHLRRGQMQQWQDMDPDLVGPQGSFLAPRAKPFYIAEEEIPRSGITLTRKWQYTRGADGSAHVWLQNIKSAGRGERASGLRWDILKW